MASASTVPNRGDQKGKKGAVVGPVSDRFGPRRSLTVSAVAFALGALLAAFASPNDGRVETPEGVYAELVVPGHAILAGTGGEWPPLLGYNQVEAVQGSTDLARANGDPLLVVEETGAGRTLARTSDIGPHWCPNRFVGWEGYESLWARAVGWLKREC